MSKTTPCKPFAIFLIAAYALCTSATAQNDPKVATAATAPALTGSSSVAAVADACPVAKGIRASQIFGLWAVHFSNQPAGLPAAATMLLERHAEFSDSLAGMVSRDLGVAAGTPAIAGHAGQALLAGDLEDGLLLLDESSDKVSITGTWNGEMVVGSCGKSFAGSWKDTSKSASDNAPDVTFTLTKLP